CRLSRRGGHGAVRSFPTRRSSDLETPKWISVEYINGGVDPETREFSPGSVLSFLNTQSAWEHARALDKPLRFSFGRADREYKDRSEEHTSELQSRENLVCRHLLET